MIAVLILLSTIISIGNNSTPSPKCPPNMIPLDTNPTICYLFVANATSFDDGEKFCNQNNGHLAPVLNAHANFFITDKAGIFFNRSVNFWLGGKTVNVNGANVWLWNWQNSFPLYLDWAPGQPSKNACISSTIGTASWSSEDCTVAKPFVCQIPAIVDSCDQEWTYFIPPNEDGMCYRYLSQKRITFEQAQNVCVNENANLTSIHSLDENTFLSNMAKDGSNQTWPDEGVFIGFHYSDSKWRWLDGTNVTYDNWGPGAPFEETIRTVAFLYPDELAGGGGWGQKWDVYYSNTTLNRFICKKKPGFVSITEKLL